MPTDVPSTPTSSPLPTPTPLPLPIFEPAECKYGSVGSGSVECGYLIVPENRSKPDSPPIRI
jgi:hypothetical protein